MQGITIFHVVLIVAFIQCAYVKWRSLLHFAHAISNPSIIADVPFRRNVCVLEINVTDIILE